MPGVNPSLPNSESYLCTGVQVPSDKVLYITGKVPKVQKHLKHWFYSINEIANISGNNDSTKTADHILEMSEQGEFGGYCFKNHTCESRLTTECHK